MVGLGKQVSSIFFEKAWLAMRRQQKETKELCGTFEGERFIFQDGTAKRCIIATIRDADGRPHTIKGECQRDDLKFGTWYRFDGYWNDNPKYGRQFIFTSWGEPIPVGQAAIESYLATAPKIGTIRAKKIYALFGESSLKSVKETPDRVAAEIKIKEEDMREIAEFFRGKEATEHFTIELKSLLSGYGFPKRMFKDVKDILGTGAPEMIKANPFVLLQFRGAGFERCDQLYMSLGLRPDAMIRQEMFLLFVLETDRTGSVWMDVKKLEITFREKFEDAADLTGAIEKGIEREVLVLRNGHVAAKWVVVNEDYVSDWLHKAKERKANWPETLICSDDVKPSEHQITEYRKAIRSAVCCFVGSPGAGKTFVVARMIQTIQKQQSNARIIACAPTGKAAQRIRESMAAQGVDCAAPTIHSLLQAMSDENGFFFQKNEFDPLDYDFIIVDESSMVDIALMASLLRAIGPETNVMFVGDPDQLSPVGRGAPLRDMIASNISHGKLTEIRRNSGDIVTACAAIRDVQPIESYGDVIGEKSESSNPNSPVPTPHNLIILPTAQNTDAMFERIKAIYEFESKRLKIGVLDFQVIVAINEKSDLSRKIFNERLQDYFNPLENYKGHNDEEYITAKTNYKGFRPTDKIICLTNGQAELPQEPGVKIRVSNGDIGAIESFWKSSIHVTTNGTMIEVPTHSDSWGMVDWDLGYAISCHKSQGSSWPVVVILLDGSRAANMICDRHWIYTAISRAEQRCYLLGPKSQIETMARKSKMWERKTFLVESLEGFSGAEWCKQFQDFVEMK